MRFWVALSVSFFLLAGANASPPKNSSGEVTSVVIADDGSYLVDGKRLPTFNARSVFFECPYPGYPIQARRPHLTGAGIYRIHVGKNGSVTSVEIRKSTGHEILDTAAIGALRRWRAKPGYERNIDTKMTFYLQ